MTHPLQIASVRAGRGFGRIGITFCPGKTQTDAATGRWERDLGVDLDAVRDWGATAIVTLIEQHELASLKVDTLGAETARRHMEWLHLPIRDVSVPTATFEAAWGRVGEGLRARLRDGFDVLVHCKGGLGRAGLTAARLLIECGLDPEIAIRDVRRVRPGAIETAAQETYVRALRPVPERCPATDAAAIRDRAVGALVGLALGDAVGTTLEFRARDEYEPLTDLVGGGPFHRKPGEWTDDTAMALALAESLHARGSLDEEDLLTRFVDWWQHGAYACVGVCDDIGITVREALSRWCREGGRHPGSTDPMTAGNGSLMRLAPVAIRHWRERPRLRDSAARQSRTTHAAPEAVDACVLFAEMLADAIEGCPRTEVLRARNESFAGQIGTIASGSWRGLPRRDVRATGHVAHALEASLWSVGRTGDYRTAVLTAANLGEDADTTAAIAGQLAGALYGVESLPGPWLGRLAWRERIVQLADDLLTV